MAQKKERGGREEKERGKRETKDYLCCLKMTVTVEAPYDEVREIKRKKRKRWRERKKETA